jgi:hypothetical protein
MASWERKFAGEYLEGGIIKCLIKVLTNIITVEAA